jgi:hypothetical protein
MKKVKFSSGELSLEGILNIPQGSGPFPTAVICHPHPLYGGSMESNVVNAISKALSQTSFISLKFNFRGVGVSEGEFSQGIGEQEDVAAAISFVSSVKEVDPSKIALVGYSAGAAFGLPVAVKDDRIKALVAISPPLNMFNFNFLQNCLKHKLLISGSRDDFTPPSRLLEFCQTLPEPKKCEIIEAADHFWWRYEDIIAAKVATFLSSVL